MITLTSAEMNTWMAALIWPLIRILGLIAAAPLFGNRSYPRPAKVALAVALAMIMAPGIPALPATDPFSMAGLLIIVQELLIGLAMGFSMRIVFAAVEMAGEVASLTMGLGFASFFDPQTSGRSSAVGQLLTMLATMMFLALDAHQVLLAGLAESFVSLPIAATPISSGGPYALAMSGAIIFSAGLQLSLPLLAALLITNVALGILTRAAPQLNIFAIGFTISLGVGLLVLGQLMPYLSGPLQTLLNQGIENSRAIPRAAAARGAPAAPVAAPP